MISVLIFVLSLLLCVILIMVVAAALFLGFGLFLSLWLPLSLTQATALSIGSSFTLVAMFYVVFSIISVLQPYRHLNDDHTWNDEDNELEDWDDEPDSNIPATNSSSPHLHIKVGRNQNCPCGSGKKFKRCCANPDTP